MRIQTRLMEHRAAVLFSAVREELMITIAMEAAIVVLAAAQAVVRAVEEGAHHNEENLLMIFSRFLTLDDFFNNILQITFCSNI